MFSFLWESDGALEKYWVNEMKKSGRAKCGNCGNMIFGSKNLSPGDWGKFSKTQKRTSRPFAGNFCFSCLRKIHKENARRFV